jgi:hypothetical protein
MLPSDIGSPAEDRGRLLMAGRIPPRRYAEEVLWCRCPGRGLWGPGGRIPAGSPAACWADDEALARCRVLRLPVRAEWPGHRSPAGSLSHRGAEALDMVAVKAMGSSVCAGLLGIEKNSVDPGGLRKLA